ncbi:Hypothetical predicted protein, partial [Pelobates cultripes]
QAQRGKMAESISGALSHSQLKTLGNTKHMTQTSVSPVQHLNQCSKNRRFTKNDATQMTARQQTPQ